MSRRLAVLRLLGFAVCGWIVSLTGCQDRQAGSIAVSEVERPELELCRRWKTLKNASDPSADGLLAPLPAPPTDPISEEEASRFQADCFLHQDIRILAVGRGSNGRLVLATKGNVSAPTLEVRNARGVDRVQRTMVNPDLVVEVREGKIHGMRAEMHTER